MLLLLRYEGRWVRIWRQHFSMSKAVVIRFFHRASVIVRALSVFLHFAPAWCVCYNRSKIYQTHNVYIHFTFAFNISINWSPKYFKYFFFWRNNLKLYIHCRIFQIISLVYIILSNDEWRIDYIWSMQKLFWK